VADSKVFMRMNLRAGRGKYLLDVEKAITVLQVPARRPGAPALWSASHPNTQAQSEGFTPICVVVSNSGSAVFACGRGLL